jgi:hypothetical protein
MSVLFSLINAIFPQLLVANMDTIFFSCTGCLQEVTSKCDELSAAHNLHLSNEPSLGAPVDPITLDETKLALQPLLAVLGEAGSWHCANGRFGRAIQSGESVEDVQWLKFVASNVLVSPLSLMQWNMNTNDPKALVSRLIC